MQIRILRIAFRFICLIVLFLDLLIQSAYGQGKLYACMSNGDLLSIEPYSCSVIKIGVTIPMSDIALSPTGTLFGITGDRLYRINVNKSPVSTDYIGKTPITNALVFDKYGNLFAAGGFLYQLDTLFAGSLNLGPIPSSAGDLTFYNNNLYLVSFKNDLIQISYTVNKSFSSNYKILGSMNSSSANMYGITTVFNLKDSTLRYTMLGFAGRDIYTVDPSNAKVVKFCTISSTGYFNGAASNAEVGFAGNRIICKGDSTLLSVSGPFSEFMNWLAPEKGKPGNFIRIKTNHFYFKDTGIYYLIVDIGNKTVTLDTVHVGYYQVIKARFTLAQTCQKIILKDASEHDSGTLTYVWDFGDKTTSTEKNPIHIYSNSGVYKVILKITSDKGCKDSTFKMVTIHALPKANAGPDTLLCYNQSYTMKGSGGVTYKWTPAKYLSNANIPDPFVKSPENQYFMLKVSNEFGCSDSDYMWLKVRLPLNVKIQNANVKCKGDFVNFKAFAKGGNSSNYSFYWNGVKKDSFTNIQILKNQYIKLTLTDDCSEAVSDSVFLIVPEQPKAEFEVQNMPFAITKRLIFNNLSQNATKSFWNFGNGSTSNDWSPANSYHDTGNYKITLVVWNSDGCTDTAIMNIHVLAPTLFIPNSFTPNNDNINDTFNVQGAGISEIHWEIYNRWGEWLFTSNSLKTGWCPPNWIPEGVYLYVLRAKGIDNFDIYRSGTITLLK